jgi:hypothetical protein
MFNVVFHLVATTSRHHDTDNVHDTKDTARKITQDSVNLLIFIYFKYITNDMKVKVF